MKCNNFTVNQIVNIVDLYLFDYSASMKMSELLKTVNNEHQILSCSELQVVETPSEMWLFIMS